MLALYFSSELILMLSAFFKWSEEWCVNADKAFIMQSVLQSQTSSAKKDHVPGISVLCIKLNFSLIYEGQDRLDIM